MPAEASALKHDLTMGLISVRSMPPGRQATALLEQLEHGGWEVIRADAPWPLKPDPDSWLNYEDRIEGLVATGIATTRTRTTSAMAELGLTPADCRAVLIEHKLVRVYGYGKNTHQTMPILEDQ